MQHQISTSASGFSQERALKPTCRALDYAADPEPHLHSSSPSIRSVVKEPQLSAVHIEAGREHAACISNRRAERAREAAQADVAKHDDAPDGRAPRGQFGSSAARHGDSNVEPMQPIRSSAPVHGERSLPRLIEPTA